MKDLPLTVEDLAKRWRLSKATIYSMIQKNEIAVFKVRKRIRIPLSEVIEREKCVLSGTGENTPHMFGEDGYRFVLPTVEKLRGSSRI